MIMYNMTKKKFFFGGGEAKHLPVPLRALPLGSETYACRLQYCTANNCLSPLPRPLFSLMYADMVIVNKRNWMYEQITNFISVSHCATQQESWMNSNIYDKSPRVIYR